MIEDKRIDKLIRLAKDLSNIITKYQRIMKPRESDKARQVQQLIKKLENDQRG